MLKIKSSLSLALALSLSFAAITPAFAAGRDAPATDEQINASAYSLAINLFGDGGNKNIKYQADEHKFMLGALNAVRAKFPNNAFLMSAWQYATLGMHSSEYADESSGGVYSRAAFARLDQDYSFPTDQARQASEEPALRALLAGCAWNHSEHESDLHYNSTDNTKSVYGSDVYDLEMFSGTQAGPRLYCSQPLVQKLIDLGVKKVVIFKSYDKVPLNEAPKDSELDRMAVYVLGGSFDNTDMAYINKQIQTTSGLEMLSHAEVSSDGVGGAPEDLFMDVKLDSIVQEDLATGALNPFTLVYHPYHMMTQTTNVKITPRKNADGSFAYQVENLGQFPRVADVVAPIGTGRYLGVDSNGRACGVYVEPNFVDAAGNHGISIEMRHAVMDGDISMQMIASTEVTQIDSYSTGLSLGIKNMVNGNPWYFNFDASFDAQGKMTSFSGSRIRNGVSSGAMTDLRCTQLVPQPIR